MSADDDLVLRCEGKGGVSRARVAGVIAAGNAGRCDQRHQLGVMRATLAEVAVEIEFEHLFRCTRSRWCASTGKEEAWFARSFRADRRAWTGRPSMWRWNWVWSAAVGVRRVGV